MFKVENWKRQLVKVMDMLNKSRSFMMGDDTFLVPSREGPLTQRRKIVFPFELENDLPQLIPKKEQLQKMLQEAISLPVLWKDFRKTMKNKKLKSLGEGIQGSVFNVSSEVFGTSEDLIMKMSVLDVQRLTEDNYDNKSRYLVLQDAFAESMIIYILSRLRANNFFWAVCMFHGCEIVECTDVRRCSEIMECSNKKKCKHKRFQMLITEKADGNLSMMIETHTPPHVMCAYIAQVLFNMACMQKYLNFVHGDFHDENCMYKVVSPTVVYEILLGDKHYTVPSHGKEARFIDFGRSYVKIDGPDGFSILSETYATFLNPDVEKNACSYPDIVSDANELMYCANGTTHISDMVQLWYSIKNYISTYTKKTSRARREDADVMCLECLQNVLAFMQGEVRLQRYDTLYQNKQEYHTWMVGWRLGLDAVRNPDIAYHFDAARLFAIVARPFEVKSNSETWVLDV